MNAVIKALQLPTQQNLKYWKDALEEKWGALTPLERHKWETRAEAQNSGVQDKPSESEIFAYISFLPPAFHAS